MGLPNIQTAQYGDRVAIEKLAATRKTNNPATDVQSFTGGAGGRPNEWQQFDPVKFAQNAIKGGGNSVPAEQGPQLTPTELEHQQMFNALAQLYNSTMILVKAANQPGAAKFTQGWAAAAVISYNKAFMKARNSTPFFAGE